VKFDRILLLQPEDEMPATGDWVSLDDDRGPMCYRVTAIEMFDDEGAARIRLFLTRQDEHSSSR